MKNAAAYTISFCFGGALYGLIEVIFRGYTHWSMLLAGGTAFLLIGVICRRISRRHFVLKCIIGAALITAVEFIFGCIFNLTLNMSVWDYSGYPLNLLGQICPAFAALWLVLCIPGLPLCELICGALVKRNYE